MNSKPSYNPDDEEHNRLIHQFSAGELYVLASIIDKCKRFEFLNKIKMRNMEEYFDIT